MFLATKEKNLHSYFLSFPVFHKACVIDWVDTELAGLLSSRGSLVKHLLLGQYLAATSVFQLISINHIIYKHNRIKTNLVKIFLLFINKGNIEPATRPQPKGLGNR